MKINLSDIALNWTQHSHNSSWYSENGSHLSEYFTEAFSGDTASVALGSVGDLLIQNVKFGTISSRHLFGLDELILFAWYEMNSKRYKRCLDLGANIGVHSVVMSRLGFSVVAYEPDSNHIRLFKQTIKENHVKNIKLRERAIGVKDGQLEFVRVLGNTTGSHLRGSKLEPYGELEIVKVEVDAILSVLNEGFDFVKMDVENYESNLIECLMPENFMNLEIMLEIGSPENAMKIFQQLGRLKISAFSQKNGWKKVTTLTDLPTSHREGSVFLTNSSFMDWQC
jgi:FkbM family methyltransferase